MGYSILQSKAKDFATQVTNLNYSHKTDSQLIMMKQLLRSATSVGANIQEAIGGYSQTDFKYKLTISHKEARESRYWIKLLYQNNAIDKVTYNTIHYKCYELIKIIFAILQKQ